jgi:hypothetical protein
LQTLKLKTIIGSLAASLVLTAAVHAQMGQMKSMPGKAGMTGCGMMGQMKMTGPVTMNGKACNMKCDMTPVGKAKGTMSKGMNMGSMKMNKPMKMTGTMACMGQTYHCNMQMTPQGK